MEQPAIEKEADFQDVEALFEAAAALKQAHHAVAFTGAGISAESGIGTFRGDGGLWTTVDPFLFSITFFQRDPTASLRLLRQHLFIPCLRAEPCEAHRVLARLEQRGIIKAVVTQNIDNLHRRAGSQKVIEVHGNIREAICLTCGTVYPIGEDDTVPRCGKCRSVLKPNCTLFGEGLPQDAWAEAVAEMDAADIVLVVGTSGEVVPASSLPWMARQHGGKLININPTKSGYEDTAAISSSMGASAALRVIEGAIYERK